MIDFMTLLWDLCTVFFTHEVIYDPFFMGLILMPSVFYVFYLFLQIMGW